MYCLFLVGYSFTDKVGFCIKKFLELQNPSKVLKVGRRKLDNFFSKRRKKGIFCSLSSFQRKQKNGGLNGSLGLCRATHIRDTSFLDDDNTYNFCSISVGERPESNSRSRLVVLCRTSLTSCNRFLNLGTRLSFSGTKITKHGKPGKNIQ